eukprot:2923260-Rhodomonas_salina.1
MAKTAAFKSSLQGCVQAVNELLGEVPSSRHTFDLSEDKENIAPGEKRFAVSGLNKVIGCWIPAAPSSTSKVHFSRWKKYAHMKSTHASIAIYL